MPYEIPTQVTAWPEHEGPARAGVNSFGFGGTNAHVLLEEAPLRETTQVATQTQDAQPATASGAYNILPLTARDAAAFPELVAGIRKELARGGDDAISLPDLGYTLAHRRQHLDARLSFVYDSREALDERLAAFEAGEAHPHIIADERRGTA
ncbi:ketoacyl-synthetase C-terminal extension domain-containing protein, partial [Lysobacter sp. 2RAB21]